MFFPVRIFKRDGSLKREFSTEQLSRLYWKRFFDQETRGQPNHPKKTKNRKPGRNIRGNRLKLIGSV